MDNSDFIDDFLANRLNGEAKAAFEKRLETDPSFKEKISMQKAIVDSVKKARAAELKAMLNNVPIAPSTNVAQVSALKIAAGVAGAGLMIAAFSYYYYQPDNRGITTMPQSLEDSIKKIKPADFELLEEAPVTPQPEPKIEKQITQGEKRAVPQNENIVNSTPAPTPKVELVDPTKELAEIDSRPPAVDVVVKAPTTASKIAVDVISDNKKYKFHYQFSDSKLLLYGAFDKSLYEVIEISGDTHLVFMYFNDHFYSLDEKQSNATALQPITDKALLSKLTQLRTH